MSTVVLPSPKQPEIKPDIVYVETWRVCLSTTGYTFRVAENIIVTVICGIPPKPSSYKAVSYLWEMWTADTVKILLVCRKCSARKVVPVKTAAKLWRIINFVSGGVSSCSIWLDALSIDQDDPEDLRIQLQVMGDIYRHAEMVSVLLPKGDEVAYQMLREFAVISQAVLKHEQLADSDLWGSKDDDTIASKLAESLMQEIKMGCKVAKMDLLVSSLDIPRMGDGSGIGVYL